MPDVSKDEDKARSKAKHTCGEEMKGAKCKKKTQVAKEGVENSLSIGAFYSVSLGCAHVRFFPKPASFIEIVAIALMKDSLNTDAVHLWRFLSLPERPATAR